MADEFQQDYNGNVPLYFVIEDTIEDIYGHSNTSEGRPSRFQGAYHPATGVITLIAANIRDVSEGRTVIRHEVLGHYGLNTLKPEDKKALLQGILNSRNVPNLKSVWEEVDNNDKGQPPLIKAEEVFAFIAENTHKTPVPLNYWQSWQRD